MTNVLALASLLLALMCISTAALRGASALAPMRIARTRQAHADFRSQQQQRRLTDIIERGGRPPIHMFETKAQFDKDKRQDGQSTGSASIKYWGGPVMTGNPTVNVHIIYYGSWPAGSGQGVIENFIRSLSMDSNRQGDPAERKVKYWWAINEPYFQNMEGGKKNVSRNVRLGGTVYDKYSAGKKFGKDTIWNVISAKVGAGKAFSYDPHGIYLLLTSKDVLIPGYCDEYCGYHTMDYVDSDAVVYSFVGHHGQCPHDCGAQSASPNGNPGLDATVSTIAHEVAEAATDPDVSKGWFDDMGEENADKCSWSNGVTKKDRDTRGRTYEYNLVGMKGMRFLIQQNWDRLKNKCVTQRR